MKRLSMLLVALVLLSLLIPFVATANTVNAEDNTIVIALDLAHGQGDKQIGNLTKLSIPNAVFKVFGTYEGLESLGDTITSDALADVDVLIFGEIKTPLGADEISAISDWLSQGNKVLWLAADSDYGGGVDVQNNINLVAEQVGTHLRVDLVSVEDPESNCGRGYRVAAVVPDEAPDLVKLGITKPILAHGPGVVAYVDDDGNWKSLKLGETYPDNVYPILATTEAGTIVENNDPAGNIYEAGDTGRFPIVAAEKLDTGSVVIVSGASPYGDYEPFIVTEYYDVALDGPRFVENTLLWSLSEAGILKLWITATDDAEDEFYDYPTADVFVPGVFDLITFTLLDDGTNFIFRIGLRELGDNPWNGPNGFCLQYITIYIDTAEGGNTSGLPGSNIMLSDDLAWEYAISVTPGWPSYLEDPNSGNAPTALWFADGTTKTDVVQVTASDVSDTILVMVPKSEFGTLYTMNFVVTVGSHDGFGVYGYRSASTEAEEWKLGGADANWITNDIAPRVVDIFGPKDELTPNVDENKPPALTSSITVEIAPAPTPTPTEGGIGTGTIVAIVVVIIIIIGVAAYFMTKKK